MCDYCLTPNEQFFSYIMTKTSYILKIMYDDVCFEPDHHVLLDFCNTSLLKQLSEVKICYSTQTHIPDSELTGLALTP
jgi:hypothetical protein